MEPNEALLHGWFYGNLYVREVGAIGFAVLMGSIPLQPIVAWLFEGLDARFGQAAGGIVPVLNAIKAFLPVAIAAHGGGLTIGLLAAFATVAAHCFCPWRPSAGGSGVAVEFGVLLALCWPAAVVFVAVWFVAAVASNYALVGSLVASACSILSLWFFLGAPGAFLGVGMTLLVAARQRAAFGRLAEGTERPMRSDEVPETVSVVRVNRQPVQSF